MKNTTQTNAASSDSSINNNFQAWKLGIARTALARGVSSMLTGENSCPQKDDHNSFNFKTLRAEWEERNAVACGILLRHCTDQSIESLSPSVAASDMWSNLESTYGAKSRMADRVLEIKKLCELHYDGNDIDKYLQNFELLLCSMELSSLDVPKEIILGILLQQTVPHFGPYASELVSKVLLATSQDKFPTVGAILQELKLSTILNQRFREMENLRHPAQSIKQKNEVQEDSPAVPVKHHTPSPTDLEARPKTADDTHSQSSQTVKGEGAPEMRFTLPNCQPTDENKVHPFEGSGNTGVLHSDRFQSPFGPTSSFGGSMSNRNSNNSHFLSPFGSTSTFGGVVNPNSNFGSTSTFGGVANHNSNFGSTSTFGGVANRNSNFGFTSTFGGVANPNSNFGFTSPFGGMANRNSNFCSTSTFGNPNSNTTSMPDPSENSQAPRR